MRKDGYYSSGSFANKAHVTKKTLRYYDEHGFLKPSFVNENGARFYTEQDFQKMQQIQMLKYLGFSLEDIREMTMKESREESLVPTLQFQMELLDERIEQMKLVRESLGETTKLLQNGESVDWGELMERTSKSGLEQSLKQQYLNSSNIGTRINLHAKYAVNKQGWFPWIFEQCELEAGGVSACEKSGERGKGRKLQKAGMAVLELGCGNGSFWLENWKRIPKELKVTISDASEGMLREACKAIAVRAPKGGNGKDGAHFDHKVIDFHDIPFGDEVFDLVIANHVLFYAKDFKKVLGEIRRVLKPGGRLICSTYGTAHMKEISTLAAQFDDRIVLAEQSLYEIFGKENGEGILKPYFQTVEWRQYEDHLLVTEAEDLVDYVISCHGNQNRYIVNDYKAFRQFVEGKIRKGFYVTKDAGVFVARKGPGK
ncbi:MAG: methyltransferase domain-containing protein [Lachnospiraceae bacterium]|nr:methyltransferase domain-containing protein [Lachnospiraceae bacterium]